MYALSANTGRNKESGETEINSIRPYVHMAWVYGSSYEECNFISFTSVKNEVLSFLMARIHQAARTDFSRVRVSNISSHQEKSTLCFPASGSHI
jgi:hypothetical protein